MFLGLPTVPHGSMAQTVAPSPQAAALTIPVFEDVPLDHWAREYIETLFFEGYIAGCSADPMLYCPEDAMTRAESAVFVERGIRNASYIPPQPAATAFADVPLGEWYAKWAGALYEDGYTAGCGTNPLIYCPLDPHTIAEGAVFYLRMINGTTYLPPAPSGIFADVDLGAWYAPWVEAAYREDLIIPCEISPELKACPEDPLTRAMGAYMMYQAKGLGYTEPPRIEGPLAIIPGAVGWGINTPAGSGRNLSTPNTEVLRVTNLNDSGPGSLRAALMGTGPRTVIFEISGTIELSSPIVLRGQQSYLTVAGQTAPSPGITVSRYPILLIEAHDVLLQHLRLRIGDQTSGDHDGLGARQPGTTNFVFDHLSVSWGIDENVGITHGANNGTIRYTLISEALDCAGVHSEGCHSRNFLMARSNHMLLQRSLIAHGKTRHPRWGKDEGYPPASAVIANNVIYNWGSGGTQIAGESGEKYIAVVGNTYQDGADTRVAPIFVDGDLNQVYLDDNRHNGGLPSDPWDIVTEGGTGSRVNTPPVDNNGELIWPEGLDDVLIPSGQVMADVLLNAGARPADRDSVDLRIVVGVQSGQGRIIDHQSEVGGFPNLAVNYRPLVVPTNPNGPSRACNTDGECYTNLELWLHMCAAEVEGRGGDCAALSNQASASSSATAASAPTAVSAATASFPGSTSTRNLMPTFVAALIGDPGLILQRKQKTIA